MCRSSNIPSHQIYAVQADIKNLGAQLVYYFMTIYKNFKFTTFFDKNFVNAAKSLIKSYSEFNDFLKMIDITVEEFFKMMVYVSPQVFTSNMVKFIQKYYLNKNESSTSKY